MPVVRDRLKMIVSEGAMTFADSLRSLAGILPKPVALDGFKFLRVEITLSTRIGENVNCARGDWLASSITRGSVLLHCSSLHSPASFGPTFIK